LRFFTAFRVTGGVLGALVGALRNGPLILRYAQDDRGE
jgi:hypothetical protein